MSATFRKDKNGIHEDKDRGHGAHWKCKCERCQQGSQHKHAKAIPAEQNHFAEISNMVRCPHCEKECLEGTPEAEFIGWHGLCAECELNNSVGDE